MTTLLEERKHNNFIIARVIDSDSYRVLAWTVAHMDLQRATAENFSTSAQAQEWGETNYKGLINE